VALAQDLIFNVWDGGEEVDEQEDMPDLPDLPERVYWMSISSGGQQSMP
jgi:hypothetical protein